MLPPSSNSASRHSVGKIEIPYYVVLKGRGYWRPSAKMRALGFADVRCGPDGPAAWAIAAEWAQRWERVRTGREASPATRSVDTADPATAEAAIVYPSGSLGEAFGRYRRTKQWSEAKKARTREDWWRGWKRIRPIFGDVAPMTIGLEDVDAWHAKVEAAHGLREAHRAMKIWRALWKVAAAMGYCVRDADPSLAVRNRAAAGRSQTWTEGEVVRLVKAAWRSGEGGLSALLAVMWDAQLSPVDARAITVGRLAAGGDLLVVERAKTGEVAAASLSKRSTRLVAAWIAARGVALHPSAPLFTTRGAAPTDKGGRRWTPQPYTKNTLGEAFRDLRTAVFGPSEKRQLIDFRRSGAVEAIAGGASAEQTAVAMGNTLGASNALFRTYVPVDPATVSAVAEARRKGRAKRRRDPPKSL